LRDKVSVGTIDCTKEKKLCQDHGIRGYPTLKFSLDGTVYEYPGGRTASDFRSFADRVSRNPVEEVTSFDDLASSLEKRNEDGVAFCVYHPGVVRNDGGDSDQGGATTAASVSAKLQSALLTQIFGQVARKEIAYGAFYLVTSRSVLDPSHGDWFSGIGVSGGDGGDDKPWVCRIEPGVAPRCYDKPESPELDTLHKFVRDNNVPTVARLGPHNFHKVGRRGRPLVISVIDQDQPEQVRVARQRLASYALVDGPESIRAKYHYAYMDGKSFQRFLVQFDVMVDDLPQLLILDVPTRTYYQNSTYRLNVDDFVMAVQDGTIKSKNAGKKGLEGVMMKLYYAIVEYRPWSVIMLVLVVFAIAVVILSILFPPDGKDPLRPPYRRPEDIPTSSGALPPAAAAAASAPSATKPENAASTTPMAGDEGKKDK
jgi:hypothetical protein